VFDPQKRHRSITFDFCSSMGSNLHALNRIPFLHFGLFLGSAIDHLANIVNRGYC
jgi:hypothetical protein